jgi:hypothetical protein
MKRRSTTVVILALCLLGVLGAGSALVPPTQASLQVGLSGTPAALLPVVMRNVDLSPEPSLPDLYILELLYEGGDEQLVIENRGTATQDMTGWWIHSVVDDQRYDFPAGYALPAGEMVIVHSGPDARNEPPVDMLWTTGYIWNDAGDTAVLVNELSHLVDATCYKAGCST